jgi:hypothetical protein
MNTEGTEPAAWLACSSCKGDIGFDETYYVCSVSTCSRGGTDFRFCSVECWDAHVPVMRHRDAWAVEKRSPTREQWLRENPPAPPAPSPPPRVAGRSDRDAAGDEGDEGPGIALNESGLPHDVLVVASKLKAYVRARSGMNTSDGVMPVLSDHLRKLCDEAIRRAARAGRKTVMDRDF